MKKIDRCLSKSLIRYEIDLNTDSGGWTSINHLDNQEFEWEYDGNIYHDWLEYCFIMGIDENDYKEYMICK